MKKILLLTATALLLSSCGNNSTPKGDAADAGKNPPANENNNNQTPNTPGDTQDPSKELSTLFINGTIAVGKNEFVTLKDGTAPFYVDINDAYKNGVESSFLKIGTVKQDKENPGTFHVEAKLPIETTNALTIPLKDALANAVDNTLDCKTTELVIADNVNGLVVRTGYVKGTINGKAQVFHKWMWQDRDTISWFMYADKSANISGTVKCYEKGSKGSNTPVREVKFLQALELKPGWNELKFGYNEKEGIYAIKSSTSKNTFTYEVK